MPENTENEIVYGITKENLWAHVQVEKMVKKLKFGSITVTLRIHEGGVTDMMTQEHKRFRKPES